MKKDYKGIIFDLDGVICYTDQYHYKAWKMLADKLGIPFDEQINNRLRGVSRMESLEIILEKSEKAYTEEEKVEMAEEKNANYRELLAQMSPKDLSSEVKETLDLLHGTKLLAIGSSSKNTAFILERIGLAGYFDAVADGNDITRSKPDPEVFLIAARRLNLKPQECLVVEDAKAGVDAAVAGGFDCAAVGDAAGYGAATYSLKSVCDLKELA
nr:beta-phosphoglucomutase [uncultured Acetatifactor sp.]